MIRELIEKHKLTGVAKALELQNGTVINWRRNGCLPYNRAGSRMKTYERKLAKLEGIPLKEFRQKAYAEYLKVQEEKKQ